MLRFKQEVRLQNLQPQISLAIASVHSVCKYHDTECLINSINDGKHSHTSLHYAGAAFDLDTHDTDPNTNQRFCKFACQGHTLAEHIRQALPAEFDVVFENSPGNEHIHIEWQPKRGDQ